MRTLGTTAHNTRRVSQRAWVLECVRFVRLYVFVDFVHIACATRGSTAPPFVTLQQRIRFCCVFSLVLHIGGFAQTSQWPTDRIALFFRCYETRREQSTSNPFRKFVYIFKFFARVFAFRSFFAVWNFLFPINRRTTVFWLRNNVSLNVCNNWVKTNCAGVADHKWFLFYFLCLRRTATWDTVWDYEGIC